MNLLPGKMTMHNVACTAWHRPCLYLLMFLAPHAASAQPAAGRYPDKPVRLVVPFAAGASTDIVARLLGQKLSEAWGQQFITDNRPGAAGGIGAETVARATPDGYTVMITNPGPSLNNILLKSKPAYTFADFAPVIYIGSAPVIVVANPRFAPNDMKELIAYAKANPGKATWGSSGTGSNPHAALENLKAVTGVQITHVPYKGTAPALTDAVGGQIDGLYTTTASAEPFIRSGRVKVLGVAGPRRQAIIPNVPTFAEQGIRGADNLLWMGLVTTGKTPRAIVQKLNSELNRVLNLPDVKQRFDQLGLDIEGGRPEHFEQFIQGQAELMRRLIKTGALKVSNASGACHAWLLLQDIPGVAPPPLHSKFLIRRPVQKVAYVSLFLTAIAIAAAPCLAQTPKFPVRPVRIVVPFTSGSASDLIARRLGSKMSESWREQVVVDNRAGAGGVLGMGIVAAAAPNGYTLLVHSLAFAVSTALYSKLPFDPYKDFSPVSQIMVSPSVVVVAPALGVKSVNELIALARQKPGQINSAIAGIGSGTHLNAEQFKFAAGIDVTHVPYKGPQEALLDVMSGRVQYFLSPMVPALPHIRGGRLLALALSTAQRTPLLPDVPTVAEAALPGYEFQAWFGMFAPGGTPKPIVEQIGKEVARILRLPDVVNAMASQGEQPLSSTPEEFTRFLHAEIAKYKKIIKLANIRVE